MVLVAVDLPDRYEFPTGEQLKADTGLEEDEIWVRALANLVERVGLTPPKPRSGQLMGTKTGIGLASSLLALDEYWDHPNLTGWGDLVVAPIERDELIVAPHDDGFAVGALRNLVARRDNSQFLTDRLLLRRNGAWEEFE